MDYGNVMQNCYDRLISKDLFEIMTMSALYIASRQKAATLSIELEKELAVRDLVHSEERRHKGRISSTVCLRHWTGQLLVQIAYQL